eukprot:CAMPEP_0179204196 /NCGR_PEP_ID=MMETSP0796-20121207/101792_1 /TAXON_ID=73915 /ORGANISM="Pyrodinium bahamense, Strain pbaha01" /LENGTH=212 /DNA_ID=CAMNT_0020909073 /DNA_START=58 /DNA_END=694 /DNA_ORIENTATION=-
MPLRQQGPVGSEPLGAAPRAARLVRGGGGGAAVAPPPAQAPERGDVRALRAAAAASLQQSLQRGRGTVEPPSGQQSPSMKAIWDLRSRQCEESGVSGNCVFAESLARGPEARQTSSFGHLQTRRTKHVRSVRSPREHFVEPVSIAMDIGWHVDTDGSGTPRPGHPRTVYPRNTCAMTKHAENLYATARRASSGAGEGSGLALALHENLTIIT